MASGKAPRNRARNTKVLSLPGLEVVRKPLHCTWIVDDVLSGLRQVEPRSVTTIITSIPYWGRRQYTDDPREIGIGSLAQYLDDITTVFAAAAEKLQVSGTCWLNCGDTAVGSGGAGGDYNPGGSKYGQRKYRQGPAGGIAKGQWADVPHRLLHRLQDSGWFLRMPVTWNKMACRPEDLSHVKRPGEQAECVFMLTRRPNRYTFYEDRLVERGNVWSIRGGGGGSGHVAPFPEELVERCLLPSTDPLDIVLDIFAGSGTTQAVAAKHGRSSIGIDFDPENVERARPRVEDAGCPFELRVAQGVTQRAEPAGPAHLVG